MVPYFRRTSLGMSTRKWIALIYLLSVPNLFKTSMAMPNGSTVFVGCESSSNTSNAGENSNQLNRVAKKVILKLVVCTNLTSLIRWQPSSTIAKNYTWEVWWNLLDTINHNLLGSNRNLIHDEKAKNPRLKLLTNNESNKAQSSRKRPTSLPNKEITRIPT